MNICDQFDEAYENGKPATCIALAEQWLETNPNDFSITHRYAEKLYEMSRYDKAIEIYEQALGRYPTAKWLIFSQLGHLHRYRGAMADAEQCYQKSIDENSEDAGAYIFLGAVQARQGKLKEAEETHRKATQSPSWIEGMAYHNLGLVLRGQGRLVEAKACFAKAIEIHVNSEYTDAIEALDDVTTAMQIQGG